MSRDIRRLIRNIFDLLDRTDQNRLNILIFVLLLVAIFDAIGIASIMPFMAMATNPDIIQTNWWINRIFTELNFKSEQNFIIFLGIIVVLIITASNLIKATGIWLTLRYQNELNERISRRLLATYLSRPYSFFLKRNTTELGKNILTEVRNVVTGVISPTISLISQGLVTVAIMILMIIVDLNIALTIVIVLGSTYGLVYWLSRLRLTGIGRQQIQINVERYKTASEGMNGIKELKVLGRELTFLKRYADATALHSQTDVSYGLISSMPRYALESVAFGGIVLVVLYLFSQGEQSSTLISLLALYAFSGYRLIPAIQSIFAAFTALRKSYPTLELLHRDFMPISQQDPEEFLNEKRNARPIQFSERLQLERITFSYEEADKPVLQEFDLSIKVNSTIGLVGPTGCGKTTAVDLILGLLFPSGGRILVDGIELNDKNMASWQCIVGYVPQDIYVSDDTIARNIAFGVPQNEIDMNAVRKAARIANLESFVERSLKDGFETQIGERGVRLSGGQRQRIGIARALYRDPFVLIMDEATSALDGVTEEIVMDAVRSLSGEKTIILIAHRLSTVRECDMIYQVESGRVVAKGTYADLQRSSDWFRAATSS